jgi:large subunit ribosomal protein L5
MVRLREKYWKEILPGLKKELSKENNMEVPKLMKIVVNMGIGDAITNKNVLDSALQDIGLITGQKPVKTSAKKAVSNFKLRDGVPIGVKVTLRGPVMYEFLDRLVNVALPRVRDFRGINPKSFDGRGNYNLGIKEHIIFPEIDFDKVERIFGMDIAFVTTAETDDDARALLKSFGMPFKK